MAERDHVAAMRAFGFSARQAHFVLLVLEHAGVCLPRQYRAFAGIAHGRHSHRFFEKLIRGAFVLRLAPPGVRSLSTTSRAHE